MNLHLSVNQPGIFWYVYLHWNWSAYSTMCIYLAPTVTSGQVCPPMRTHHASMVTHLVLGTILLMLVVTSVHLWSHTSNHSDHTSCHHGHSASPGDHPPGAHRNFGWWAWPHSMCLCSHQCEHIPLACDHSHWQYSLSLWLTYNIHLPCDHGHTACTHSHLAWYPWVHLQRG